MTQPLHRLERRFLKALSRIGSGLLEQVAREAGISLDQARRALEWLRTKRYAQAEVVERKLVSLASEGMQSVQQGLPERRLVEFLKSRDGKARLAEVSKTFRDQREFSAALGYARSRGWISLEGRGKDSHLRLKADPGRTLEEELLSHLTAKAGFIEDLPPQLKKGVSKLMNRPRYLAIIRVKQVRVRITPEGAAVADRIVTQTEIDVLTPELLRTGAWRKYRLRPLDVEAPAALAYAGRKHPLQRLIDEVREVFVSLGFQEVEGPIVRSCFWNFDALFTPQDHPAREMQDTFYLSGLTAGQVASKEVVQRVSAAHWNGGATGSKGWGYRWSLKEAQKVVLRTHTTTTTVNYLSEHTPEEARIFSVGRIFRNEKPTYKNLVEFHQIDGITVGRHVTLRDMMGLLAKFYERLGLGEVKFWPTYFPYTEPSLQSVVYYEKLDKWIELCGMGIFRPEVTLPLDVRNPVLAWGGGLERMAMLRHDLNDVRALYENNLGWLRGVPVCR